MYSLRGSLGLIVLSEQSIIQIDAINFKVHYGHGVVPLILPPIRDAIFADINIFVE